MYSDEGNLSEYALSKYLQITPQRIRNLKEKASIKYSYLKREIAIAIFMSKTNDINVDDKYIDIPVYDAAVKTELEAILDENSILLYTQLNPKIFRLRLDDFMEVTILLEIELNPTANKDEIQEKINNLVQDRINTDNDFAELFKKDDGSFKEITKTTFKEALVKGGMSLGVDILASFVPGGVFFAQPVKHLLETIKDKI